MAGAAAAGAVAFSDFPEPHADAELLRRGLLYAKMLGKPVFDLPRDAVLSEGGVAAEGAVAEMLGLFAVSDASERIAFARAADLRPPGGRLHFTAVTEGATLAAVSGRFTRGPQVLTAAVPAAHLMCEDRALRGFDPAGRVDPPFRGDHRRTLREAVAGAADFSRGATCLTAGHRPDPALLDPVDLLAAPPGFEAFETTLPCVLTACGADVLPRLTRLLTAGPTRVLGLAPPSLSPGSPADLAVFDPEQRWAVDPATLAVPVARTPLAGKTLSGRVTHTILGGRVVFERGTFLPTGP